MAASMSSTSSLTNSLAAMAQSRTNSPSGSMWTVYLQCCKCCASLLYQLKEGDSSNFSFSATLEAKLTKGVVCNYIGTAACLLNADVFH